MTASPGGASALPSSQHSSMHSTCISCVKPGLVAFTRRSGEFTLMMHIHNIISGVALYSRPWHVEEFSLSPSLRPLLACPLPLSTLSDGEACCGLCMGAASYTEEKIRDLVNHVLQLQLALEGANFGTYDADLETLAAATKAAATAARQVGASPAEQQPLCTCSVPAPLAHAVQGGKEWWWRAHMRCTVQHPASKAANNACAVLCCAGPLLSTAGVLLRLSAWPCSAPGGGA